MKLNIYCIALLLLQMLLISTELSCMELIVHDGSALPGQTIEIQIDITTDSEEEIQAFGLYFIYNIENLFMTNMDNNLKCELTDKFDIQSNDPHDSGIVIIGGISSLHSINENSSGCFLRFIFEVNSDAVPGEYLMSVEHLTDDIRNAEIKNGVFTILPMNSPTLTPTCSPTPTPPIPNNLTENIFWERDQENSVDTLITIINISNELETLIVEFYDRWGDFLGERDIVLRPEDMQIILISREIPDVRKGFGYAKVNVEKKSVSIWSAVVNESRFKGYTIPRIKSSFENIKKIPFWQVEQGKIDTIIFFKSSHICGTDVNITLYSSDGLEIKNIHSSFPEGELGQVSLSDFIDYCEMGSATVEFESSGLSGAFITGLISNLESKTSYPIMVDNYFSNRSVSGEMNSISIPFWQVLQHDDVDSIFFFQNTDEFENLNLKLFLYDEHGGFITNQNQTIKSNNVIPVQLGSILFEGFNGIGSAEISFEDGILNTWAALFKASNQTGYNLNIDIPKDSGFLTIPFWQYNPEELIDSYLIVKNMENYNIELTFDLFDVENNFIEKNVKKITPKKVHNFAISEMIEGKGIGYGFLLWDNGSISLWGMIFSAKTGTGFTIDFD